MLRKIKNKLKEKKGFTLIEMIIVIAIIAILIALIAPNLMKYLGTAKQTKADAAAKTLYTAANTYLVEMYAKGTPVSATSTTWNQSNIDTNAPTLMSDYFNSNEVKTDNSGKYTVSFTITFDDKGDISEVTWTGSDGVQGKYPK